MPAFSSSKRSLFPLEVWISWITGTVNLSVRRDRDGIVELRFDPLDVPGSTNVFELLTSYLGGARDAVSRGNWGRTICIRRPPASKGSGPISRCSTFPFTARKPALSKRQYHFLDQQQ